MQSPYSSHEEANTIVWVFTSACKEDHWKSSKCTFVVQGLIDWVKVLRPIWHKWVISETFFPANLLAKYWKTKTNTTKQTCICNKIYYNINLTPKTKVRFGRLLRPPASKRRGPILVSVFHKFVTYLRHLPTYLQHRDQQRACGARKIDDILGIEIVIAPAYSTNIR